MKRRIPFLIGGLGLLAVLLIGTTAFASPLQATGCFSDTNGHWAETFICLVEEYGIVGGYPDGTFRPERNVTRAESAVMFQNSLKVLRGEGTAWNYAGGFYLPTLVSDDNSGFFGTVTVDAPSDGGLIINGYLNIQGWTLGAFESDGNIYARVDGNRVCRQYYQLEAASSVDEATATANIAVSTYTTVSGGTHTIDLEALNNGPDDLAVFSGGINVLFVPFDGTGAVALPVAVTSTFGDVEFDQSNP